MGFIVEHPKDIHWIESELPDVHTVPKDCSVLVWTVFHDAIKEVRVDAPGFAYTSVPAPELEGKFYRIFMTHPWENKLNPIRWDNFTPYEVVKYWAWIDKGE